MLKIQMSIDLGCGYVRVAKQLLHRPQILAGFEQMARERVSKCVRMHTCCDAESQAPLLDSILNIPWAYAPATFTQEKGQVICYFALWYLVP